MTHVIYKNCSTFQKKHVGQYSEGIGVFKFEKYQIFGNVFSSFLLFLPFTIYTIHILFMKIVQYFKRNIVSVTQRE